MAFNAYEKTNPRLRKNKAFNEGLTAGGAKTPQSAGSMSKAELQALGERHGWDAKRELSISDIREMGSVEYRFHELLNPNFAGAFERAANIKADKHNQAWWDVRKKWTGQTAVSDEERQRMKDVAEQFYQHYPQVIRNKANNDAIWEFMREQNLAPTEIASPIQAFQDLAQQGKLTLNPSAISAGPESSVSGTELTTHRHFHLLLQSHRRPTAEESMSSQEFYEQHKELHPGKPYLIRVREQQQAETEKSMERAEQATVKAGSTSFTDYGPRQNGAPRLSDIEKASLRHKVRTMSARELADKCENDPSFKAALDALEKD